MEPMEASKQSTDPQEVIDFQDDHLVHRDEQESKRESEPQEEVLTNDIEKVIRSPYVSMNLWLIGIFR